MEFIKGKERGQVTLLPDSVEEYIGEENATRIIDAYVERLDMGRLGFEKSKPNDTGHPMYAPKDMLKLYIYGYMNRVRSSRNLEKETHRNLEVIWLMKSLTPDHKTIARFRQRNAAALKQVFRDFVKLCADLGLYGKELIAIDGSKFKACNSKERNFTTDKLKARIERIDKKISAYLEALDTADADEAQAEQSKSKAEMREILQALTERKALYKGLQEEMKESEKSQISLTDPDSRLMKTRNGMVVCLNVQSAVDCKNKMIVEFDVGNQVKDLNQMWPMTEKATELLEAKSMVVLADAGYDSASDIARLAMEGHAPQVAGTDFTCCIPCQKEEAEEIDGHRNGRSAYIAERNIFLCPMGEVLYPSSYNKKKHKGRYANSKACERCAHKCTVEKRKVADRKMEPAEFERAYDTEGLYVRQIKIKADGSILKQRQSIVEHPFGVVKRALGVDHLLLRGKEKASGEIALAFLAFNLKRAINILGVAPLLAAIG